MKMKRPIKFYKSGSPSHVRDDPSTREQSTAELLKWISDVTIKRRSIRRSTHCSNLFAEAILSSALRKAKKELASKQEEKRKKLQLFCLERIDDDDDMESCISNNDSQKKTDENESDDDDSQVRVTINSYVYSDKSSTKGHEKSSNSNSSSIRDEEVSACLSSLESFFNELKSVKVSSSS